MNLFFKKNVNPEMKLCPCFCCKVNVKLYEKSVYKLKEMSNVKALWFLHLCKLTMRR